MSNYISSYQVNPGTSTNDSIQVNKIGDSFHFSYAMAKYGFKMGCFLSIIYGLLIAVPFGYFAFGAIQGLDMTSFFVLWFVVAATLSLISLYIKNRKRNRGQFELSSDAIKVNGKSYPLNEITSFHLIDAVGSDIGGSIFVAGGSQLGTAMTLGGVMVGHDLRRLKMAAKQEANYKIVFKHIRKKINIATKMDAETSQSLFQILIKSVEEVRK